MRLLEHEAKHLLAQHGCPTPSGKVIKSLKDVKDVALPAIVKAQIPQGGRGKAGGIKIVRDEQSLMRASRALLGSSLLSHTVEALLIEKFTDIQQEFYLSIGLDRSAGSLVLLAHTAGGIEIEASTQTQPPLKQALELAPSGKTINALADYFGFTGKLKEALAVVVQGVYETCVKEDALLVEVNPLILSKDELLLCADAKIELDDAAAFRHAEWHFNQTPASSQFVVLNQSGKVASMANGAGLAMATMDAIEAASLTPANFFDAGGGTNAAGMVAAFQQITALPNVQAIVINIFGGITRCDEVARAILSAQQTVAQLPKLFVRLTGTNEAEAKELLATAGIITLPSLATCIKAAKKELRHA